MSGPAVAEDIGQAEWWHVFRDESLNDLETRAANANKDIANAVAHLDAATALSRSVGAAKYPSVAAAGGAERNREPKNRPNNATTGRAITYSDFTASLVAGYEADVWGRVRRSLEVSNANAEVAAADLRFVRLSIQASLAAKYFALRVADMHSGMLRERADILAHSLELLRERQQQGITGQFQVAQARAAYEQTESECFAVLVERAQLEHAIALILGVPPESFHIGVGRGLGEPPVIPLGLPADLLARRPDIAATERRVAAASAGIGLAKASYLPSLSLSGVAGYQSTNAAELVNWQSSIESLAASIVAPVFTGGRRRAAVEVAIANYRASLHDYEKSVLHAYVDVEDQIEALKDLQRQEEAERQVLDAENTALMLIHERYSHGLASYGEILAVQQTLTTDEDALISVQGQRMLTTVALVRALGGGWQGR